MSAETIQEFAKATFPSDLFDGFSDEAAIEKTMHNLLDAMVADKRTHRELAISGMAPLPHIEAAKALCLKNGLHPETFLLLIHSNLTWLEHHTSRLGSDPPPPGLDVLATILEPQPQDDLSDIPDEKSARKKARRAKHTSQPEQQQAEQDSHSFEEAAAAFVKSTTHNTLFCQCFVVPLSRIWCFGPNSLPTASRRMPCTGHVSSATALPTPWADPQQSASHMLSRSKLCTWTQGERDDVMTGVGMIHLRQYRFQLKMLGQYEAVEWCMKMTPQAFFKRISFSIMPDSSPQDEDINCSLSFGLWHPGSTCHPLQPNRDTRVVAIDVAIPAAHGWLTIPSTFSANPGKRAQTRANPREPARTRANPRKPAQTRANPRKPAQTRANPRKPAQTRAVKLGHNSRYTGTFYLGLLQGYKGKKLREPQLQRLHPSLGQI